MSSLINYDLAVKHYPKSGLDNIELFRRLALCVDQNPGSLQKYYDQTIFSELSEHQISSCLERTKFIEALSYGDVGVLLACPGPALSGWMLRELGTPEQQSMFFDYVAQQKATTFLAVTEPSHGSDAGNMQTRITRVDEGSYALNGEKWLVGHGSNAPLGVAIAKIRSGPLGIAAVFLTPECLEQSTAKIQRHELSTVGLRGARLSRLIFNDLIIPEENILGRHLSAVQSGMMTVVKTFNRMRPGVAAFAIGHAQAMTDYIISLKLDLSRNKRLELETLTQRIHIVRKILYNAAASIDKDPMVSAAVSLAKYRATALAEQICQTALHYLGPSFLFDHPLFAKWYRDVYGYEYMEGTMQMQLHNVYQGYRKQQLGLAE